MSNERPNPIQPPAAVPAPDYFTPDTHTAATATDPGLPPVGVQPRKRAVRRNVVGLAVIASTVVVGVALGFYASGPNLLQRAAEKCQTGTLSDSNKTLLFDMAGEELGSGTGSVENLQCLWTALDLPMSTQTKMMATRALDGRQSDTWKAGGHTKLSASWSYHPDDGLDIIFELAD